MKTRKIIVEIICFILLMNFFYEGIYKIAYWGSFGHYIKHAPLLEPFWQILVYCVPGGEIILALTFFSSGFRIKALYISIAVLLMFVFWIMSVYLFTPRLFWPYHALWKNPTWMQKMLISLGLCWLSFTALIILRKDISYRVKSTSLRNMPANAS